MYKEQGDCVQEIGHRLVNLYSELQIIYEQSSHNNRHMTKHVTHSSVCIIADTGTTRMEQ